MQKPSCGTKLQTARVCAHKQTHEQNCHNQQINSTWVSRRLLRERNAQRFCANQWKWRGVNYTWAKCCPSTLDIPPLTWCVCAARTHPKLCFARSNICRKWKIFGRKHCCSQYMPLIHFSYFHKLPTWCCNPITEFSFFPFSSPK